MVRHQKKKKKRNEHTKTRTGQKRLAKKDGRHEQTVAVGLSACNKLDKQQF